MSELTIIITMAGLGTRFRRAGYDCPKYMIEARGRTLFEWSMDSLLDYYSCTVRVVFVVRRADHAEDFIREKCVQYGLADIQIVQLDALTDGQATTCMLALPLCCDDNPILIYNIDTYVEPGEMRYADLTGDGHIPCFHAIGEHWSFVRLDESGKVEEVKEKERISDNCTLGAYYFSSAGLFTRLYNEYYGSGQCAQKEKYIAPMYNLMIEKGMSVTISLVDADKVHVLGTPEELKVFLNK